MCESCNLSTDSYNIFQQNSTHLYLMKNTGSKKMKTVVNADNSEIEKAKSHIIVEIIEYIPNSVVSKTIIKKLTGHVSLMSLDTGEGLSEKTSPFAPLVPLTEG